MKKSELRSLIREMLREELLTCNYLTESLDEAATPADRLLATHVCKHPDFESACLTGDATRILAIVDETMEAKNMYTPGAKKLRNDIARFTMGQAKVPAKIGEHILFFVWHSQASGVGKGVL